MIKHLSVKTHGQALYDMTAEISAIINEASIKDGLCSVFVQHTSASLIIQENADPAVQNDLNNWFNRLVAENDPLYTHIDEGPDDMPAHIKSVLTATSLSVPIEHGRLVLGTWQGIYLWEHRHHGSTRRVVIHLSE